jgi:hypothetical protein
MIYPSELENFGISAIRKITDLWAGARADSLIDYTKTSRVEPVCLIDSDVLYADVLPDVMQSLLSIFAGYYLQAVAISTTIGHISVDSHLGKLNPRRDVLDSAAQGATNGFLFVTENYADRLPLYGDSRPSVSMEETKIDRDTVSTVKELSNLSVGKLLNVEIIDGAHKASIPISIRLMASTMPSSNLVHILSVGSKDNSAKERYHGWKSGQLSGIKDMIFCQDIIDEHRKNLMKDDVGIYTALLKRNRANQISTLVSGNPSVATASNIAVMSSASAEQLELQTNLRLSNFANREKLFKSTYLMLLVVIDKQYDQVTIYHRGIDLPTEISAKGLKAANKGSGPDVSDILKAYQVGNSPSL